jgi:EAL domain-containing protein (putative c-di-GMP-specific phosphodiesterase class I)/GGDEF domain-containing protein
MSDLTIYGMLSRLRWPGYRGKIAGCAVLAAACSAVTVLQLPDFGEDDAATFGLLLAATGCLTALVILWQLLRPIGLAADALQDLTDPQKAADLPTSYRDEAGVVMAGIAGMAGKIGSLHHRWVQRHPLSALPTREYLMGKIAEDLKISPDLAMLGVIRFADYDRLSAFDTSSADLALKAFAARLVAAVGKDRPLAHVDRDCFAIWFRGVASAQIASTELQAICYALSGEIVAGEMKLVPEVEAGAALYPEDGADAAALITRALVSLAKPGQPSSGKFDLFSGQCAVAARERFSIEQDLRHAISREQLELHFQPVVDLAKGRLVGAEALLRWRHPTAGMVPPSHFVPILEDAGLTDEFGMWTLNAACREARNWQLQGLEGMTMAVNLSATQLHDPELKSMITRTLARHKLRPQALELELTETAATEDAERTFALFGELRAMGISLAIDDFGSGYSSLSYVKNLPFDKLKIDREFVIEVHDRRDSQAICRSLIELARGLEIKLLAEGVETAEEVQLLRSFGCTLFQGYFFSRPLPAKEFLDRARDRVWLKSLTHPVHKAHAKLESRMSA